MQSIIPIVTSIAGFIITAAFGVILIPFLRKIHFGQTILEIGPKWHKKKEGTPIMGGFMFMVGTFLALIIGYMLTFAFDFGDRYINEFSNKRHLIQIIAGLTMALMMSFIGFMDDYIKAVKKQNLGLRARQKTMLQLLVASVYLITMYFGGMTSTVIPFIGRVNINSGAGLVFWPIALIFIYGFTNAVNITDGIDGLATSVTIVVTLFYMLATSTLSYFGYSMIASALIGSLIGFLVWNLYPCKIMMGDTGSMFLGGIIVAFAFSINRPILLLLSGILYFCEAMSVVIQVSYYKRTKKRIFKMSPIHHHFELSGWSENKIVLVFSTVALAGCTVAMILLYF